MPWRDFGILKCKVRQFNMAHLPMVRKKVERPRWKLAGQSHLEIRFWRRTRRLRGSSATRPMGFGSGYNARCRNASSVNVKFAGTS